MTTSDKEWQCVVQQMITSGKTSDKEWSLLNRIKAQCVSLKWKYFMQNIRVKDKDCIQICDWLRIF